MPKARIWIFFSLALLGAAADLLTKHSVFQWLGRPGSSPPWWLVEDFYGVRLGVETSLNTGALFGMGQNRVGMFAILSILAAVGVVCWVFFGKALQDRSLVVALGAIMGGIIGNLYDRLGLWQMPGNPEMPTHAVRDWILCMYGRHTWPNFNIADCLLVGGAGLLMWHAIRNPEGPSKEAATSDPPADA